MSFGGDSHTVEIELSWTGIGFRLIERRVELRGRLVVGQSILATCQNGATLTANYKSDRRNEWDSSVTRSWSLPCRFDCFRLNSGIVWLVAALTFLRRRQSPTIGHSPLDH